MQDAIVNLNVSSECFGASLTLLRPARKKKAWILKYECGHKRGENYLQLHTIKIKITYNRTRLRFKGLW